MSSINKAIIIGHLGRDPETRYMPNGDAVTNIAVATSEQWKDKNTGEKKEQTEWHRVTFYRKLAEIAGQYLSKGSLVYLEGKLQTRKYTDKDGIERYTTEIVADTMQMLGSKGGQAKDSDDSRNYQDGAKANKAAAKPQQGGERFSDMDDDIPFNQLPRKAWMV